MLFTRCPDCETTFRITADALRKADGQVRCGRCACVFNAFTELRRRSGEKADGEARAMDDDALRPEASGPMGGSASAAPSKPTPAHDTPAAMRDEASVDGISFASVISELRASAEVASVEHGEADTIGGDDTRNDAGDDTGGSTEEDTQDDSEDGAQDDTDDNTEDDTSLSTAKLLRLRSRLEPAKPAQPAVSSAGAGTGTDTAADAAAADAAPSSAAAKARFSGSPPKAGRTRKKPKRARAAGSASGASTKASTATEQSSPGKKPDLDGKDASGTAPDKTSRARTTDVDAAAPAWVILDEPHAEHASTSRKWAMASIAAAALLAVQAVHHYRSSIAGLAVIGPWLQGAYAMLGSDVSPHWDLAQYEILSWDAAAEPDADGRGHLHIAARVRNRGPREQPLPYVHVQLKDRWDGTLGSRVFSPAEYLEDHRASDVMMRSGRTIEAQLDIFDPSRDAYGFEIDVCIDAPDGALRCATDEVFR